MKLVSVAMPPSPVLTQLTLCSLQADLSLKCFINLVLMAHGFRQVHKSLDSLVVSDR